MRTRIQLYMGKEGISMSNSIMMRLIKCLSIIMLVIGCVQPTSVQAYSPVLTETFLIFLPVPRIIGCTRLRRNSSAKSPGLVFLVDGIL